MVKDPVCGMQISKDQAAGKSEYEGKSYYFCSAHCKDAFNKQPAEYVKEGDGGQETHHHHC